MKEVRSLVITGFGINCEEEMAAAYRLVNAELERHAGIEDNPLGIKYCSESTDNNNNNSDPRNSLDYYIQKGLKTIKEFQDVFEEMDQQTLDQYQQKISLVTTIAAKALKQVRYHRETGKYISPYNL